MLSYLKMKIKDSLVVYLPQRIIVFSLHNYFNTLITRILNKLYEWEVHPSKKFTGREYYFKFFAEKEILDILLEIKTVYKDLNIKIFTFYKTTEISNVNLEYLNPENNVTKTIVSIFKKVCKKYFCGPLPENLNFKGSSTRKYKNISCGEPTGEECEFLIKLLNKLSHE